MPEDVATDLIFDLGLHRGEDTEFYLAKGYRVVAVDASKRMCEEVGQRLGKHVASGALTIVNCAIAPQSGDITFYQDEFSAWSTVDAEWAKRNVRKGSQQQAYTVQACTTAELFERYGVPYYLKIDIEGMDLVALRGLESAPARPRYVSLESDKVSFRALRTEFDTFVELGYDAFKLVSQRNVPKQVLPQPAREGSYVPHTFELGSSGAFGEEAPGQWLSADEAIEQYRRVFLKYMLNGDDPLIRSRLLRNAAKVLGFRYDWYDTHARLAR